MKSSFQTIILIIFGFAFVAAVAVFSGLFSSGTGRSADELSGTVMIWGTLPSDQLQQFVNEFNGQGGDYTINYQQHTPEMLNQDIIVALANGYPPDVVLVSSELFLPFKDKLFPVPYAVYDERAFRNTNVDGAQIFLSQEGVISIPLLVDPLVVYYNKDMLAAANYVYAPTTWEEMVQAIPVLTRRSSSGTIGQSAIALGETVNVYHFRDILSALFIQSGSPIVAYDPSIASYSARLDNQAVAEAASFYASFADPTSALYSWNRSLPNSLDMFLSGRLAFYIGRASELFTIQAQNPNLNFDVAELFQPDGSSGRALTFGSFIGASVMKAAPNFNAAYAFVASLSGSSASADSLSKRLSMPPARRDLLTVRQDNPYVSVFFKAALSAFSWPDPNAAVSEQAFRGMISDIASGRTDSSTAVYEAQQRIQSNIR